MTTKKSIQETLRLAVASLPPFSGAAEKLAEKSRTAGLPVTVLQVQRAMAQAWTTSTPDIVSYLRVENWEALGDACVRAWGTPAYLEALRTAIVAQVHGNRKRATARRINRGVLP